MFEFMDNPGFGKDGDKNKEKEIELAVSNTNGGGGSTATEQLVCTPEVCRMARQRYPPPDLGGSPWHLKKTIFLVGLIVLLVVWIVVYATLSQLNLL